MTTKARLFLADDSRTMRNFYGRILEPAYEVSLFDDGLPLLEAARANPPDVIVSDVNMPEMSGIDLVRALKSDAALQPIPVILLTANEAEADSGAGGSVDCLDAGADDYLQKPFKPEELLARARSASRGFELYKQLRRQHLELETAYRRLAEMEVELRNAQKLEAVGRLAAGIAHEINTPIQYIVDNTTFVRDALRELGPLMPIYRAVVTAAAAGPVPPALLKEVADAEAAADVEFTLTEAPRALDRGLEGANRVADIVRAMKDFGREDGMALAQANLNETLRSTLEVARAEVNAVAELETDYTEIPPVECQAGAISQVFLHLITNAAHAVAEAHATDGGRGRIRVATSRDGEGVAVAVTDDGTGIAEAIQHRVFDPFFTTKEVGRGSGQGLTISRSIVEKHGGTIRFETGPGQGSTFVVRLPTRMPRQADPPSQVPGEETDHVA
jgi:signal transduction histidine kinase